MRCFVEDLLQIRMKLMKPAGRLLNHNLFLSHYLICHTIGENVQGAFISRLQVAYDRFERKGCVNE